MRVCSGGDNARKKNIEGARGDSVQTDRQSAGATASRAPGWVGRPADAAAGEVPTSQAPSRPLSSARLLPGPRPCRLPWAGRGFRGVGSLAWMAGRGLAWPGSLRLGRPGPWLNLCRCRRALAPLCHGGPEARRGTPPRPAGHACASSASTPRFTPSVPFFTVYRWARGAPGRSRHKKWRPRRGACAGPARGLRDVLP